MNTFYRDLGIALGVLVLIGGVVWAKTYMQDVMSSNGAYDETATALKARLVGTGGADISSDVTSIKTAVQIMDDWDESDRAKVNLIASQAGITAGAGAVAANSPRVTLASDDPAVTALQLIDNAISGSEMQVDVVAAIPAGTNNIGDVDIVHPRYDHDNAIVTCGTSSTAAATGLTAGTTQIKFSARTEDIGLCWGDNCACAPASLVGYWLAEGRAEEETADDTALNCCSTGGTGILSVSIRQ